DSSRGHREMTRAALRGGVKVIQFRDKNASDEEMILIGRRLREITKGKTLLIINDRVNVAKAIDADGVHLGKSDLSIAEARRILGKEKIIGASANTAEEAVAVAQKGADYIGLGPIFATPSKEDAAAPAGIEAVRKTISEFKKRRIETPLIVIGGINETNAASVLEAGAQGIAVISAVSKSKNMKEAVEKLLGITHSFRKTS
ncbi:thiamine phosphate synthase, partial [Candidatus Micrarchaeota archaeon]|nr:thiamine phosphate synthase [Candidatus Micrarchaeota archaeon]